MADAATDVPATIGHIIVNPGKYAVADGSAVIFVCAANAERVVDEPRSLRVVRRMGTPAQWQKDLTKLSPL